MTDRILLRAEHIKKYFPVSTGLFQKKMLKAVDDVSLYLREGETLALVGESGCGKSTLGKTLIHVLTPTEGTLEFDGEPLNGETLEKHITDMQMIFQDPYSSLDPRMTVLDIIAEPLKANYPKMPKDEREQRVIDMARRVGLNTTYLKRYPHAFSGGQRQRVGIARALILNPRVIVCDEAVSALDVSIQAQVINLLKDLQKEMGLTYIFISHDLSVVEHISNKVGVMYLGEMVEFGETEKLFSRPRHPYTEALLSAVPVADPDYVMDRIPLRGEIPNPANPPAGCYFHERCSYCTEDCRTKHPSLSLTEEGSIAACLRMNELRLRGFEMNENGK